MNEIVVGLGERCYAVRIERGLLARAGDAVAAITRNRRIAVVADAAVAAHTGTLCDSLRAAGLDPQLLPLTAGEGAKSWTELEHLTDTLLDLGVARGDHIIAIGGGTIGDLAGFAAAIVKRGVGVIHVPTTLLAQVDSAVGGKTGINTRAGKNLIGAFHQPSLVLIDPEVLTTLPSRELRAGYAEVVKYGLIDDPVFFAWCEGNGAALLAPPPATQPMVLLEQAIAHAVAAKARIVAVDEHETSGARALLNLGHTFAHALEAAAGYDGSVLHGEAVAAGLALAFALSAERGLCPPEDAARVAAHLRAVGLSTTPRACGVDASGAELVAHMRHDKKASGGVLPFVLARGIGAAFLDRSVDPGAVAAFLDRAG